MWSKQAELEADAFISQRRYRYLLLHEMETADCNLGCRGCYLKADKDKPHLSERALMRSIAISSFPQPIEVHTVFYLNNLTRDPHETLMPSNLLRKIKKHGGAIKSRRLITDSMTMAAWHETILTFNYDEFIISPRNKHSFQEVEAIMSKSGKNYRWIYTIGVDSPVTIEPILESQSSAVEINIKKPWSIEDYVNYSQLTGALVPGGTTQKINGSACTNYVAKGRNCHRPEDESLEVTTFKDEEAFYTCAYPTRECIARNEEGK